MKLKHIILFSHIVIILFLITFVVAIFKYETLEAFKIIELKSLAKTNNQTLNSIHSRIRQMHSFAVDWGIWDDMYEFLNKKSDEFIESSFSEDVLEPLGTEAIIILDKNLEDYFSFTYNERKPALLKIQKLIKDNKEVIASEVEKGNYDILIKSKELGFFVWFVVQPVSTTARDKDVNGFFVLMKVINDGLIGEISKENDTRISIGAVKGYSVIKKTKNNGIITEVFLKDDKTALLVNCFNRTAGQEVLCLTNEIRREFYESILALIKQTVLYLALVGFVILLVNMFIINKLIVRPSVGLAEEFDAITSTKEVKRRLNMSGPSEFVKISESANKMLCEIEGLYDELQELSCVDGLTELYNKRYFNELYLAEYKSAVREQKPVSLILLDIDSFKKYNDNYGHLAGDACLAEVAETVKQTVNRATDIVARFGGEEFIILLPNTDLSGLKNISQKIIDAFQHKKIKHDYSDVAEYLTVSAGGVTFRPTDNGNSDRYIAVVDKNLYRAKHEGKNRFVATEEMV